ncbi:MAG: DUF2520 domain-containing protein [Proteobacteria bacterium]|jgi:predicted short-subunit dehydrogenase-like oxidoreductase (DUF2520 family)|nr:DUF2520 domain-containing protein [Pseudomonadota bacterium]
MNVVFIGLGRMGFLQARLARYFGDTILAGIDIDTLADSAFGAKFMCATYDCLDDAADALANADLVWITVTDGEIESVAKNLSGWVNENTVVLHTSGALSSSYIRRFLRGPVASMHPLVACPLRSATDEECVCHYADVYHVIEGDELAVALAQGLVARVGGKIAQISCDKKVYYHAAAVFASNYPMTLVDISQKMLVECGFDEASAREATCRMLEESLHLLRQKSPELALTGPVKRRDAGTIDRHREALLAKPEYLAVYDALLMATKRMTGWIE